MRRPPRSTRTDSSFPTRRSSDLDPRSPQGSRRAQRRPDRAVMVDTAASKIASLTPKVSADTKRLATRDNLDAAGDKLEAIFTGMMLKSMRAAKLADDLLDSKALDRRSEEHKSELQSLKRLSYAFFCLNKN